MYAIARTSNKSAPVNSSSIAHLRIRLKRTVRKGISDATLSYGIDTRISLLIKNCDEGTEGPLHFIDGIYLWLRKCEVVSQRTPNWSCGFYVGWNY